MGSRRDFCRLLSMAGASLFLGEFSDNPVEKIYQLCFRGDNEQLHVMRDGEKIMELAIAIKEEILGISFSPNMEEYRLSSPVESFTKYGRYGEFGTNPRDAYYNWIGGIRTIGDDITSEQKQLFHEAAGSVYLLLEKKLATTL